MPNHAVKARDDRGFTLIELLVVIVILGIIILPLGNALIAFLRNSDNTVGKMSESHDLQIAAAYFAQDVQSVGIRNWATPPANPLKPFPMIQSVEVNAPATSGPSLCPTGASGALVRLAWDDPTAASVTPRTVRTSYVVTGNELHRITTWDGVPKSDLVLAHNVDVAAGQTVDCVPDSYDPSNPVPQQITLTFKVKNPATSQNLTVTLVGQRRQT